MFLPLFTGGKVCINGDFNPDLFLDWLAESQATWYSVSPPIHLAILQILQEKGLENRQIYLRFIRSGAASLSSQTIEALEQILNVPLIEAYGMTEIPNLTSNRLNLRKLNSVGKSIGSEIAIIDKSGNFLPIGETGEIIVRGENVISSYLNNDAKEKSFINGWLKTGDLGYLDEDGYLFLQGRLKEIINRGGNNISPQEIDNLLLKLPEIKEAVTFPIPHQSLGEDVISAVVLEENAKINVEEIKKYLTESLAEFKIPSKIIIVPEIPKVKTGKSQRFKLKDTLKDYLFQPNTYIAPRSQTEIIITNIWEEVLKIDKIGVKDDFLALGGNSISATQIVNRIVAKLGVQVSLKDFLNTPTIAEMAEKVELILTQSIETGEI
ncbi:MAG: non-ribosomal peptide synthetase [Gomphosphaeria aponina SAG 52.96 = DSM 107014]|uniref:Non-ribosomal peptide synthetase n=1 Tax=Gomphosphaeria aponina SAG 52.96 = DSM 107014 TaxID=1521640 RepID=A0A941JNW1_9CHRO|nr:non-ribosomal peptide synthetase [Gomphosphaeria aponina SAG 52.96 = DSM 107014]